MTTRASRRLQRIAELPPIRRLRTVLSIYNAAGGSLLAEGLAYSALFAGLTGLLFAVGLLGYVVPAAADRQRIIDGFTGQAASFAPIVREGLNSVAAHAGPFSVIGLAGLAWGASHFYGALDTAIGRVFALAPARGFFDRLLRSFVSVLVLVGGLLSGIGFSAIEHEVNGGIGSGPLGDAGRILSVAGFPIVTAVITIVAVGALYRIVPNTAIPLSVLRLPAIVAGLALTCLTELLVYIAPILTGALSVFGGVATVFAALAWLHLAFQVLLIGAAWTRFGLDEIRAEATAATVAAPVAEPVVR